MFRRAIISFLFLVGCECSCHADAVVVSATLFDKSGARVESKGTAISIYTSERGSILLTCKHVVENAKAVWVAFDGDWHLCENVKYHPTEDIASMECAKVIKETPLTESIPVGMDVIVDGASPGINKNDEEWWFRGKVLADGEVLNDSGLAVIPGDSGGPVYCKMQDGKYAVGGIVFAYPNKQHLVRRSEHRTVSLYTPTHRFMPWLTAQYCPNGRCPIQVRPQVVQPYGPLGFPRGPSRVIGVVEPVPQQYVPVQPQQYTEPQPIVQPPVQPQPQVMQGPAGPRGEQGPVGPRGEPGMDVDRDHVEAIVNAWLDSNIEQLRGPAGPAGPAGDSANVATLEKRISDIERKKFRILITNGSKVVDDESYDLATMQDKPVILDLNRLRNVSGN